MKAVRVASLDPSFRNFGVARLVLKLETFQFGIESLHLIETEKDQGKQIRRNSDDLKRCQKIIREYHPLVTPCSVVFAEIPTGAQSARAATAFGIATALVASCPVPVIQVQPTETKLATVGTKTASKEEMIEWAVETYPNAPWIRDKKGKIINKNEHLADAVAVAHAGVQTDQFEQLLALLRSSIAA